jgi:hypothetical protein
MGNRFFTVAVPLHSNEMLPASSCRRNRDSRLAETDRRHQDRRTNVIPGSDSSHYAMRRILDKKKLFRFILPD